MTNVILIKILNENDTRSLTCRFLPESPPPPGEAATRAAAIAEGALDNGDAAVEENRRNGMLASA